MAFLVNVSVGSLQLFFIGALKHEDGVVDLQGGAQLDGQDLDDVRLGEQQKGLAIDLLEATK